MSYSTAPRPATEKQVNFVKTLMSERIVPEPDLAYIGAQVAAATLTMRDASAFIDKALHAERKPVAATVVGNPLGLLLMNIPVSRYAIPVAQIEEFMTDTETYGNDHLFVAVEKGRYGASKGRLFLNRLAGSVGGFSRLRFAPEDALTVARYLSDEGRAAASAQRFGHLHNQCGVCGADLTDHESRRLALGPTCRQRFHL